MSEPFVFDPRCQVCKTPFGAVSCGQTITFQCRPLASEHFDHCALVVCHEFAQIQEEFELTCHGPEAERLRFSLVWTAPATGDLVWYYFRFWREDSSGCDLDRTGYRSDGNQSPWQLTVYEESDTPQWFGEGVTYQIFPDRFCRLSIPDPTGLVGDREVHADWAEEPVWRVDAAGEIRNRDFFGGSLAGILSKLDYLKQLGVTTLYLCPIFESASNHRYNTADYTKIDPMLGTEADFRTLCAEGKRRGMRVLLDGVFNHTGSQSLYFNADGFYPTLGAAQSQDSPWYSWYHFHAWPHEYDAWWGIDTLPAVEEASPSYVDAIIDSPDSVIRHWLEAGGAGWRLDVADELPDWFIAKIRALMGESSPDSVLLGEVWEDGSNKIAYSQRRRYLLGGELHGLMNYPFRSATLGYLLGGDAGSFQETMETIRENYPPAAFYASMNFLGTHDTPRILTVLGADRIPKSRDERAAYRLSPAEHQRGSARVRLAAMLLFTFPGSPTVYYGDEVGMQGFEDPFNRGTYPWGQENPLPLKWFALLGGLRSKRTSLQRGSIEYLYAAGPLLAFARREDHEQTVTVINAAQAPQTLPLPWNDPAPTDLLTGQTLFPHDGTLLLELPPLSGLLLG